MPGRVLRAFDTFMGPRHYFALLVSLLGLTVLAPLVDHNIWTHIIVSTLMIFSLLTAALTATNSKKTALRAFFLAFSSGAMWILAFSCHRMPFHTMHFQIAAYMIALVYFATTCGIIWRDVFSGEVTTNRICGAVCIYLLIGFCFAMIHMMTVLSDSSSYKDNLIGNTMLINGPISAERRYPLFVYFSFCTLTTVGYGDVVPVSRMARTWSWLEGVTGQLYLAILVARLVGLHVANRSLGFDTSTSELNRLLEEKEREKTLV